MKKYKVAVVGASGNVGREMIKVLEDRKFPVGELICLASKRSAGSKIRFNGGDVIIQDLSSYDFTGTDIALFSPGSSVSKEYAPKAGKQGCIVIDNTSYFRMNQDVPLVVPEVNPEAVDGYKVKNIIANPNCSTAQMLVPLAPLHKLFKIKRIVVSTYQSVSGAGKEAMDELYNQTKAYFEPLKSDMVEPHIFTKPIAFNCIPHIDVFMQDGNTKEEWKMIVETKKIMDENIEVSATCVRVPVFVGHAESVNVEFEKQIPSIEEIRQILENADGVQVIDRREDAGYTTNKDCVKEFPVYVSRLRIDGSKPNTINMWIVADNIYGKGAALNSVQIAETLIKRGHI
jgi:aspartate-semialdehyde dehydrogenase